MSKFELAGTALLSVIAASVTFFAVRGIRDAFERLVALEAFHRPEEGSFEQAPLDPEPPLDLPKKGAVR